MSRLSIALTALFAFAFTDMFQAGDLAAQQQQVSEQPQARDSITGTITEMAENEMTVRTDDERSMIVRVDRQTEILDERGQRVEGREGGLFGDLGSGDWVVVHYRAGQAGEHLAASVERRIDFRQQARGAAAERDQELEAQRQSRDSITGTITAVAENELTLRTDEQQSMTVKVDRQTRILDERGQRVEARGGDLIGNLNSGDRVVVNHRAGEDASERIAVSIEKGAAEQHQLQRQDELPRTSSALPFIAALGLLGFAGAGALSVAARRRH